MYQLVSAIVKPLDSGGRWRSMDISTTALDVLFKNFRRVIVTLSNVVLPNNVSLDLEQLRANLGGLTKTFGQWLTENGGNTLPTSNSLPTINTRYAHYSDAVRAGHKVTPIHPTISPSSPLPIEDKPYLLLTKAGADYADMYKHTLVNVNGFYHQTDYSTNGLYVLDGMKSCLRSGRNEIGVLSFKELGNLSFIPITDSMIYTQQDAQQLRYNCYIDTGVDLSNKTVMLILGGYMQMLDNRKFFRVSNTAFGLDFGQIAMVDRYYESFRVLDYTSLQMEQSPNNDGQISINNIFSDHVLRRYLQLSQSFFVVLDNAEIFTDQLELKPSPYPGTYTSFQLPVYPLSVGHGAHQNFWPRKEYDRYSISVHPKAVWGGVHNYETVRARSQNSVSDATLQSLGFRNSQAHFQLIGSDFYIA